MVCMYFFLYLYLYLYWRDWKNCVGQLPPPVAVHPFVLFERSRLWKEMFLKQFANIFCYGVVLTRFQLKASLKSPNYTMKWSPPQVGNASLTGVAPQTGQGRVCPSYRASPRDSRRGTPCGRAGPETWGQPGLPPKESGIQPSCPLGSFAPERE